MTGQVVLSFALIPLVALTSCPDVMAASVNRRATVMLGSVVVAAIRALNLLLVVWG